MNPEDIIRTTEQREQELNDYLDWLSKADLRAAETYTEAPMKPTPSQLYNEGNWL